MKKQIGYIGLGKMGAGMATRLIEHGWEVTGYDPYEEARSAFAEAGGQTVETLNELPGKLTTPRLIWLMVPHAVVDDVLTEITPLLEKGDVVIDGGNSNFNDTVKRNKTLTEAGIHFLDAGVSGGPSGARNGACTMVGGDKELFDAYEELFKDISAPDSYGHMGRTGAGHFVKMVHNGIEYGMMQAIGEGFEVLKKSDFDIDLTEAARVYNNNSVIESRLVDWLHNAYKEEGEDLERISGKVSHSGEGLWTVETAKSLGVPVTIIEESLMFRQQSQENPSYTGQVVSALRNQFGGHEVDKKDSS